MEYLLLRLARRFLFRDQLVSLCHRWLPYYSCSQNEINPKNIANHYQKLLSRLNIAIEGKTILEVGAGATNGVGHWLVTMGASEYIGYEPFAKFDELLDNQMQQQAVDSSSDVVDTMCRVSRVTDVRRVPDQTIDLIVSHSVLEHVQAIGQYSS